MSFPTRLSGLGSDVMLLREKTADSNARRLAMSAIEVRFATAMIESAMPKSQSSFGKGLGGSVAREHLVGRIAQILADSNALGVTKAVEQRDAGNAEVGTGERDKVRRPA